MPSSTVFLSPVSLSSRLEDIELSMQGHLNLNLPPSFSHITSVGLLLEAITCRHLWIARQGAAELTIIVSMAKRPLGQKEVTQVSEWVKDLELWKRMGIRLQHCEYGQMTGPAGTIRFSVQHPDLTSAITAPESALVAEYMSTTCTIDVYRRRIKINPLLPRGKRKRTDPDPATSATGGSEGEFNKLLSSEDHRTINKFMAGFIPDPQQSLYTKPLRLSEAKRIIETSLSVLLLGGGRKYTGFRVENGIDSVGLIQLAPGVFHMPYLKVVRERAKLLPIISGSLARMINGESPSLREKTMDFAPRHDAGVAHPESTAIDNASKGIEKRAWEVLLSEIKQPVLSTESHRSNRQRQGGTLPDTQKTPGRKDNTQDVLSTPSYPTPVQTGSRTLELFDGVSCNSQFASVLQEPQTLNEQGSSSAPNRQATFFGIGHGDPTIPREQDLPHLPLMHDESRKMHNSFEHARHQYTGPLDVVEYAYPEHYMHPYNHLYDPAMYDSF